MRRLAVWFFLLVGATFNQALAISPVSLFGSIEYRAESHAALPKWRDVLTNISAEEHVYDQCYADSRACPNRAVMAWQSLLAGLKGTNPVEQVTKINRFVNQWNYRTDRENFGLSDYWASPLEFMQYSGDCEDYAITKYVSLRRLGFPAEDLRMVVVQDTLRNLAHAVLAVYLGDQVFILDNLTNAVLPHDRIFQYVPYYSVNETTRWAHAPTLQMNLSQNSGKAVEFNMVPSSAR